MRLEPTRAAAMLAALVAIAVLACAAPAFAAPPANDDFANREVLVGSLPIEVTGSTEEATKESGESAIGFGGGGHSVWYEWEATFTGWASVQACGDIEAVLWVYTGTAVNALAAVVGPSDRGPFFCYGSESAYTFWVEEGSAYEIAVDGSVFYLPPTPQPTGEGDFTLRLEATPIPPNDDFAAAQDLLGEIDEEPDGNRIYYAGAEGFNWGATKEPEEPDHRGDPGGASIWYSWTAPETGNARINVCCARPSLLSLYSGASLGDLEPVTNPETGTLSEVPVTAGTTYRIAVDGPYDEEDETAAVGSFSVRIIMVLGPKTTPKQGPPPAEEAPAADTTPPQTKVTARILKHRKRLARFRFVSSEPGSRFRCRLDRGRYRNCTSPVTFRKLRPGRHVFRVFAVDAAGNRDRSPTIGRFSIDKGKKKARRGSQHKRQRG